jgi:simple sugar transport system permease protein
MGRLRLFIARDREFTVLLATALIVLVLLVTFMSSRFFALGNLQSMGIQVSEFGFLALAMGVAMLTGGIDLSIVAAAALAGILGAKVMSGDLVPVTGTNGPVLMALGALVCLVTGLLCGLLNGVLIAKLSIPPILATLGTMILFGGIGMAVTSGQSVGVAVPQYAQLATATVAGLPVIFLMMLAALAVAGLLLTRTRLGRRIYLFGENEVGLRFSGARTERVVLMAYATIGLLVGIAAMIMVARVNSARVGFGEAYLLQSILVVVLAGFNPYGGKGRVASLLIALLLLQVISSAFNVMMLSPYAKNFIWGAMLLVVMVANFYARRWKPRKATPPQAPTPLPLPAEKAAVGS